MSSKGPTIEHFECGASSVHGVRARTLLEATGKPFSGSDWKPTTAIGPNLMTHDRSYLRDNIQHLEVEFVKVASEIRIGVISGSYSCHDECGMTFFSESLRDDVGYILCKDTGTHLMRGRNFKASCKGVSMSSGDSIELQLHSRMPAGAQIFELQAFQRGKLLGKIDVTKIFERSFGIPQHFAGFAVQFFTHGDSVAASVFTSAPPPSIPELRILHISDTHGLHREIEKQFPMPSADILLHTGDYTNHGFDHEHADFNSWLGEIRPRFKYIVVIAGNHEYGTTEKKQPLETRLDKLYLKKRLTNATHVLEHELAEIEGLRIFGSSWVPWHAARNPGSESLKRDVFDAAKAAATSDGTAQPEKHYFHLIPREVDILMTHGPVKGIFASVGAGEWGYSEELRAAIDRARPKAHFFGHLHEQRGQWIRGPDGKYKGGVEYRVAPSEAPFRTTGPPPVGYPCDLISCNAMKNHPRLEGGVKPRIAGPGRLVLARRSESGGWSFTARPA